MARKERRHASTTQLDQQAVSKTSWEPIAKWYDHWAGKSGNVHHQTLAIPTVMHLLSPKPNERIVDVGCGTGVLAPHITGAKAYYVGVDASPKMLKFARKRHGKLSRAAFCLGDAARLHSILELQQQPCDAAVFLLSLQDMEPLEQIIQSTAKVLKASARMVLLVNHPCFRVPRQSGWGWDESRKLQFRRIDRYLTPMEIPFRPVAHGKSEMITSYHRPLQDYVNALSSEGFLIHQVTEVPAYPGVVRRGPRAKAENAANREIPVFLGISAVRSGGSSAPNRRSAGPGDWTPWDAPRT